MKVLEPFRREIDALDDRIVELLARRRAIVGAVGLVKQQHGIPARLPDRIVEVRERNAAHAATLGLDPDLVRRVYDLLIEDACAAEEQVIEGSAPVAQA